MPIGMFPAVKQQMERNGKQSTFHAGLAVVFGSLSIMCLVALPASGLATAAVALHGLVAVMNGLTARLHYQNAKEAIRFTEMTNEENPDEAKMQESLDRLFGLDRRMSKKITAELVAKREIAASTSSLPVNTHLEEVSQSYSTSRRVEDTQFNDEVADNSERPSQERLPPPQSSPSKHKP